MKKWVISAVVYFLVVFGAYYAYTGFINSPTEQTEHSDTEQHDR